MNTDETLDLLRQFVAMHTENGNEKVVADLIDGIFKKAGIASKVLPFEDDPTRANLVAEIGHGKPVLCVTGHMDTVSAQQEGWLRDPFTLTEEGDMFYGRGVTDMKGGLAAIVAAMVNLKAHESQMHGTVRFLATAGEEVGMPGARRLHEQGYMKDVDALLVGEPSGYSIIYATKGELNLNIRMKGKAAHSSMPDAGINAVEAIVEFLTSLKTCILDAARGVTSADLGDTVFNIDVIRGGRQVNAIPESASAEINIRIIPELSNKEILAVLDEEVAKFNENHKASVSYDVTMDIVPVIGPKDSKLSSIVKSVGERHLRSQGNTAPIPVIGVSGGTDGSELLRDAPRDTAYVVFGPGNRTMHCINESLPKSVFFDFIEMYNEIFDEYLGINQ
ncbi:succinyl-diaminopimelate desuccinylase [Bifidobacterium bohemicum]|uniref:Peptidase M20 family protein n=1 Tax=Bifidobacterium bohemicum DSM 22767 TaxID=1437606 RepID=A0A086ZJV1_9BIFI|nr:ArgE/DapE family deacylase [Bifidobacterium bohemicum]KFI46801.1 peptidase M20 family protein [Bifidobacterium bohemicum DSM 22767]SCB81782.1 succinyl-diaminopimelate desuccinylase [Bifidobacterium bohemicum]